MFAQKTKFEATNNDQSTTYLGMTEEGHVLFVGMSVGVFETDT